MAVLVDLGGRAGLAELLVHCTRGRVRAAERRGDLVRAGRGQYVLAGLPPEQVAAAACRGVLSHANAALALGLDVWRRPRLTHVTVPPGARPRAPAGVRVHWSRLEPHEHTDWVTTTLRTVLDCSVILPPAEALAVADSALRLGRLDACRLAAVAQSEPARRRGRCSRVALWADPRPHNAFESVLRGLMLEAGLTGFVPQLPVDLGRYTVHVDLGDPVLRIAIEGDSYTHHGSRGAFNHDCERYDELTARGWLVLRFTWEQVRTAPDWVVGVVRQAMANHGFVVARPTARIRPGSGR